MEKVYDINFKKMNALDFGVPQSRERIFIVGFKKNSTYDKFSFPKELNIKNKYEWGKPNSAPKELYVESYLVPDDKLDKIPNANEIFKMKVSLKFLKTIKEGELNRYSFRRVHRYKYAPTICYGNNEVFLHPYKHRRLSVRESLRLQGVSDGEYVISPETSITKKFKMISNAVPPPLAKAVAKAIRDSIKSTRKE
jgi:DNA (cytosine-5)-methyltransferase 1